MRSLVKLRINAILKSSYIYSHGCTTRCMFAFYGPKHCQKIHALPQFGTMRLRPNDHVCNVENVHQFSTTSKLMKSKDRGKDKKKSRPETIDVNEMGQVIDMDRITTQLDKAIDIFKDQMIKHVALRSSTGAIEELRVKFDGDEYMLQELVQISRKPKMVVLNVSAFPQSIPSIIESLSKNQMNLNPQQEGTTIYIPIPKVTKEHRENLSKNAKAYFNKYRDTVRDIRNKQVKDLKSRTGLASDLVFRVEGYIDVFSNQYIAKAEKILQAKQKELSGSSD